MSKLPTFRAAALALLLTLVSTPAHADLYSGTSGTVDCLGGGTFTITDNVVTSYDDCAGEVVIPAEVTSMGQALRAPAVETMTFAEGSKLENINVYGSEGWGFESLQAHHRRMRQASLGVSPDFAEHKVVHYDFTGFSCSLLLTK